MNRPQPTDVSALSVARPTTQEIVAIGQGFRARTWPPTAFHHREHLIMTLYLVMSEPEIDWEMALPPMIRSYNEAHGGVNSDSAGYHHTITLFYLRLVRHVVASLPGTPIDEVCLALLGSSAAVNDLPLRCYSRERLMSVEARRGWVEPDFQPIDFAALLGF